MMTLLGSGRRKTESDDHQTASNLIGISQIPDVEAGNVQSLPSKGSLSDHRSMYEAASEGDWEAAETLLSQNPGLGGDEITERGDRALHVAAARKHTAFVEKLVERVSPFDLAALDGHGYTACCYAAVWGDVEMVGAMMRKNPNLSAARDKHGVTPLYKAALHRNPQMVSYFLKCIGVGDLSDQEWLQLLFLTIRTKMYVTAVEILDKNGVIATMRNEEGITGLHELARQNIADTRGMSFKSMLLDLAIIPSDSYTHAFGKIPSDFGMLAKKLWKEMHRMEERRVVQLIKSPSILHDAAKAGNVEIITMLTTAYPNLIWDDIDSDGHTIFHLAVMHRHENIFSLIHDIGAAKHFVAISQDENGDNILHLAARPNATDKVVADSTIQIQRQIAWFMEVEAIVPPPCLEMRNKDGYTPQELFSKEHKLLFEKSETWMKNTSGSCMLVATLLLSIVFAAVFSVPGGFNGETGIPIHLKSKRFTSFVISDVEAVFGATMSITVFWSIMTSSFEEDHFLYILPNLLRFGLIALFAAIITAISTFVSAYFLMFVKERAVLVISVMVLACVLLVDEILDVFAAALVNVVHPVYLSRKLSRPNSCSLF